MDDVELTGWAIMDKPGVEIHHVLLTFRAYKEDGEYVSYCEELGVPSSGATLDEALANAIEATILYLNTLEELGERRRVFDERKIDFGRGMPTGADGTEEFSTLVVKVDEVVTTRRLAPVG